MKKLLVLMFLLITTSGFASSRYVPSNYAAGYNAGYHIGYNNGKNDHQDKVFKVIAGSFLVIVGGAIIYELAAPDTRWTTSQNGIGYRF